MQETQSSTSQSASEPLPTLPAGISMGSTLLVASTENPTPIALNFRVLSQYTRSEDSVVVVTTAMGADETLEQYTGLVQDAGPAFKFVDTVSRQQSLSAQYSDTPVVFTPSPDDLERLLIALFELADTTTARPGARHVIVRSLTPILETTPARRVGAVLNRINNVRSSDALCLVGFNYTAHDQDTLTALAKHVDGILWVSQSNDDAMSVEYQPITAQTRTLTPGGSTND